MFNSLKKLFGKKEAPAPRFSAEETAAYDSLKETGLEKVLGPMYPSVYHAIIPYAMGGPVDVYMFAEALPGTVFATMELIEPDGSGPLPSRLGVYELVACTRYKPDDETHKADFEKMLLRQRGILTKVGWYSRDAVLNPGETAEVPGEKGQPNSCLIFDEYKNPEADFMIGDQKCGLLLVIEVFESEMSYAMEHGSHAILFKLKQNGYYPYSDLDRKPVV